MTRTTDLTSAMVDRSTLAREFMPGEADTEGNHVAGLMSADSARAEHRVAGQNGFAR